MTVNWQGVLDAVTTQFNAEGAINFATTVKMIDEVIKAVFHSETIKHVPDVKAAFTSLINQMTASRFDLTRCKLD